MIFLKPHHDLDSAYRSSALLGAALFADLLFLVLIAEGIRRYFSPFHGWLDNPPAGLFRVFFYTLVLSQIFIIKWLANWPLKKKEGLSLEAKLTQLQKSSLLIYSSCDATAFFGLILFFINGKIMDFYIFLSLSVFYLIIYFPRTPEWDTWISGISSAG